MWPVMWPATAGCGLSTLQLMPWNATQKQDAQRFCSGYFRWVAQSQARVCAAGKQSAQLMCRTSGNASKCSEGPGKVRCCESRAGRQEEVLSPHQSQCVRNQWAGWKWALSHLQLPSKSSLVLPVGLWGFCCKGTHFASAQRLFREV